jgi:hypothetical protein
MIIDGNGMTDSDELTTGCNVGRTRALRNAECEARGARLPIDARHASRSRSPATIHQ